MRNALTQWARVLAASLADAGVLDVVISPGSRSTPFIAAMERERRFRRHDAVDERAAAFFALGQARATGKPSVLLCTSGSAAAHYMPAVVEAAAAHLPMVVVTADRPFELQDCCAAQTTDQVKMFGSHVRRYFDPGTPDTTADALRALRRIAAHAVFSACWPTPGPVHLNARARKPLEPVAAASAEERDFEEAVTRMLATPIVAVEPPRAIADPALLDRVAGWCLNAERGVIVAGPAPATFRRLRDVVRRLATTLHFPVFAEASSQLRFTGGDGAFDLGCDAFDTLLGSERMRSLLRPDVVLCVGAPATSGSWERYQLQTPVERGVVFTRHAWTDPNNCAAALVFGDVEASLEGLVERVAAKCAPPSARKLEWVDTVRRAETAAWEIVDRHLAGDDPNLAEGRAVRAVLANVPAGSVVVLGNSLPIRHVDAYVRGRDMRDLTVLCQRGINGIEGLVAGTLGSASVDPRPTTLLLGDVSLLHDLSSLVLTHKPKTPVVIVVINNRGGRIFEQLPVALPGVEPEVFDHIATPHELDFAAAAKMYGVAYEAPAGVAALGAAVRAAHARTGVSLVEVTVEPHGAVAGRRRVFADVDDALASVVRRHDGEPVA